MNLVRRWLDENGIRANDVMVAVTANAETASSWGVKKNQIFSFDSGVGGRYSLWSAVGLPAMIAVGNDVFCALLDGAASMDRHFLNTPLEKNLPVIMGLLRIWHRNYLGKMSYGVIPYDQRLLLFPEWVRQLEMESNGKSVDCHGKVVSTLTGPLIWGGVGTSAQHSFFQWLHQSTDIVPIDILIALKSATLPKKSIFQENYRNLVINALAQSEALAVGSINEDEPHLNSHGNRPSILICWNKTTPYALGRVLSLYEHITVTSGFLWGINSFDQWGVELGKEMARDFLTEPKKFSVSPSASFFLNMLDRKNND